MMEDIGLFKQVWKWFYSHKQVYSTTRNTVCCFRDNMMSKIDHHWPLLCSGCVKLGIFSAILLMQWKDCCMRGLKSLPRLSSAALLLIMWSCFLSLTSISCLAYLLLTLKKMTQQASSILIRRKGRKKSGRTTATLFHSQLNQFNLVFDHQYLKIQIYGFMYFDRLFERGMSFVGKDYLCHLLWDTYIEFEYSQKQWSTLAHIFILCLKIPTKKLNSYYDSLKKFATIWKEEIVFQGTAVTDIQPGADFEITDAAAYEDEDIPGVIKDLLDHTVSMRRLNALEKYLSIGEHFYHNASQIDANIQSFEGCIKRPYFHVKPLDLSQLGNWHYYLDFVEMQGDFDWTVKLYEKCLIPCANYPEFWIRYVELMESNGGREIAKFALDRATHIFVKGVPAIHLFSANFREKIGDVSGARSSIHSCSEESDSDFIERVKREANMEKRLGNFEAAYIIYEKALEIAKEKQMSHVLSTLYLHFGRFKYMVNGCLDTARSVILQGFQQLPRCKLLLEGWMNFEMMHRGPWNVNLVDSIIGNSVSPGPNLSQVLSPKDRQDISNLYLQFVDQCGTIDDIRKAWERHRKLFPHIMSHTSYNCMTESQDVIISLPSKALVDKVFGISTECLMLDRKLASPKGPDISNGTPSEGIDDIKKTRQPQVSPEVVEQSEQNVMEQNSRDNDLVNEVSKQCKTLISVQHCLEGENEVKEDLDVEPKNTSKPPELENLSINPLDEESRDLTPTVSHDGENPRPDPRSHASEPENDGYTCMKSDHSSQDHVQADSGLLRSSANPSLQPTQFQSQTPPVLRSILSDSSTVSDGNWSQINLSRQTPGDTRSNLQGYPQNQTSVTQSGIVLHQVYPQLGQYPQMQPASIVQQQSYAFVQPPPTQAGSQPFSQAQMHSYPIQSGQMQTSQAYINQLWYYYYQQQHLQQVPQPQQLQQKQLVLQQHQQILVSQQILVPQQQQQQQQPQLQWQLQQAPLQTHSWNQISYYQQSRGTTQPNSKSSCGA